MNEPMFDMRNRNGAPDPEEERKRRRYRIFERIWMTAGSVLLVLAVLFSVRKFREDRPEPTPAPTKSVAEIQVYDPQEERAERLRNTSWKDVEEEDYEDWREYHEFEIEMMFDGWENMESSAIESVSYVAPFEALGLVFVNNDDAVYVYFGVPRGTYREMLDADSAGGFYQENIKGQYPLTKYLFDREARRWLPAD